MEYGNFKRRDNRDFRDRGGDNRDRGGDNRDRGGDNRDRSSDNRDRPPSDRGFNRDRGGDFRGGGGGGFNRDRGGDRGGGFRERGGFGDRGDRGDREPEESVFSKRVRAGKRRTYFFDVRKTKGSDFFITITESTRREDGFGYKRHKIFLYKEDFNRFVASLNEVVSHVKTDLMPEFDYEEFDRRQAEWEAQNRDMDDDEERSNDRNTGGDETEPEVDAEADVEAEDVEKPAKEKEDDEITW